MSACAVSDLTLALSSPLTSVVDREDVVPGGIFPPPDQFALDDVELRECASVDERDGALDRDIAVAAGDGSACTGPPGSLAP